MVENGPRSISKVFIWLLHRGVLPWGKPSSNPERCSQTSGKQDHTSCSTCCIAAAVWCCISFPSLRMEMIPCLNGMKRSLHQRHLNSVKHTLETSPPVTVRGNNHSSDQTKGPSDPLSPCNRQVHVTSPAVRKESI